MPQMAPLNWTLMYLFIMFLYFTLMIMNFFMFSYKSKYKPHTSALKINSWK
uniref:ATP synthase F0 subunit 8 n=1 Tax=Trigonopterus daun TaxID=2896816 RepID=A0A7H1KI34_9CUCU|nr:ATP synthase F0 subunit 8 [Trigonopterus daun]